MLKPELNYHFYLKDASLYYCDDHNTLRVCDQLEDGITLEGVTRNDVNHFIEKYFEYVLELPKTSKLIKAFKEVTEPKEKVDVN